MKEKLDRELARSGYSAPGFAERYDRARPRPPSLLLEWLPRLVGVERPWLVVDLGSGTGLSTRPWADRAEVVVGVEPNEAMRRHAERLTQAENVRYVAGSGERTGLDDASADVVTCSQSLQWMEPDATFAEIGRILRPGGVFAAYQYVSLQTLGWEPEAAWGELRSRFGRERERRRLDAGSRWTVSLERLDAAGCFRATREHVLHSVEEGDGERLVELALSEGSLTTLLAAGVSEHEVGLDRLREIAAALPRGPWWIGYRVWLGLRA